MTYGWAILVVLVAISSLAYFGVLEPARFLPEMCTLPPGLSCLDHSVSFVPQNIPQGVWNDMNQMDLVIKNNLGSDIKITEIFISDFNDKQELMSKDLSNGQTSESPNFVTVPSLRNGLTLWQPGEEYSFTFDLTYRNEETDLPHTVKGYVRGKVI